MKEKILETFKVMGFEMEDLEGLGYGFLYEGKQYLYMPNESDEDFLNIALPAILDIDDESNVAFYQLMDKLNGTLKYVKANKLNDSMWLFYEHELFGGENLEQLISRMILHLEAGTIFIHRAMAACEDDNETSNEYENPDAKEIADNEDAA